jgi:hypothetical protein
MPAKDIYHDNIKNDLIKDGWTITDDPYVIQWGRKDLFVDLGAEKLIAASQDGRKIAVSVINAPTNDSTNLKSVLSY